MLAGILIKDQKFYGSLKFLLRWRSMWKNKNKILLLNTRIHPEFDSPERWVVI